MINIKATTTTIMLLGLMAAGCNNAVVPGDLTSDSNGDSNTSDADTPTGDTSKPFLAGTDDTASETGSTGSADGTDDTSDTLPAGGSDDGTDDTSDTLPAVEGTNGTDDTSDTLPAVEGTDGTDDTSQLFPPDTDSGTEIVDTEQEEPSIPWAAATALTGCGCNEATQVCGADNTCIDKCDENGRCLDAIIAGEKEFIFLSGDTVILSEEPQTDALGNPISGIKIWQANLTTGASNVVYETSESVGVLGTVDNDVVLLESTIPITVHRISLSGTQIAQISLPEVVAFGDYYSTKTVIIDSMSIGYAYITFDAGYLYYMNTETQDIWRQNITHDELPELFMSSDSFPDAMSSCDESSLMADGLQGGDGVLWLRSCNFCAIDLAQSTSPVCTTGYGVYAEIEGSNSAYALEDDSMSSGHMDMFQFSSQDAFLNKMTVFSQPIPEGTYSFGLSRNIIMFDNWGYIYIPGAEQILSFPLYAGYEPQELFALSLITSPKTGTADNGVTHEIDFSERVRISSHGFVWAQPISDAADGNVVRTQLLSIPQPPHMCDANLPCLGEGETCGIDGLCTTN